MAAKPRIAIVGPGRLGSALAFALKRAGYRIGEVVSGESRASRRQGRALARRVGARWLPPETRLNADLVWFCVPDREIACAAGQFATIMEWRGVTALHSSGALSSAELRVLRRRGAAVASVHPLMTFVSQSRPLLAGVSFALEGDAAALRIARRIVHDLGANAFAISKDRKAAYHAWCGFTSPLLIALLVMAEKVARSAGISTPQARRRMLPILRQTLNNYAELGPARAFSGPIVRGEAAVVRRHLKALKKIPGAAEVYIALARTGLRHLPARNRKELKQIVGRLKTD